MVWAHYLELIDGTGGGTGLQPDLPVRVRSAENHCTVGPLRADLEEIGHKFLVFLQIDTAEAWDPPAAMAMDMKQWGIIYESDQEPLTR